MADVPRVAFVTRGSGATLLRHCSPAGCAPPSSPGSEQCISAVHPDRRLRRSPGAPAPRTVPGPPAPARRVAARPAHSVRTVLVAVLTGAALLGSAAPAAAVPP